MGRSWHGFGAGAAVVVISSDLVHLTVHLHRFVAQRPLNFKSGDVCLHVSFPVKLGNDVLSRQIIFDIEAIRIIW